MVNDGSIARVVIRRPKQWGDRLRGYSIMIDGDKTETIRAGEEKWLEVGAGAHEVRCQIDWCGSNTVRFDLAGGDVAAFEVRTNVTGWRLLLAYVYLIFMRNRWLSVKQLPPTTLLPEAKVHQD